MIKLTIVENGATKQLNIGLDVVTIGRAAENLVKLDDKKSSRKHGKIEVTSDGLMFTDLGSSNGTKLNGQTVTSSRLKAGDEIVIGEAKIIILDAPAPAAVVTAPAPAPVMAAPKPAEVVAKEPVPAEDKAEVRKKIEERLSAVSRAKVASPVWVKWATAAGILVAVAIIGLIAVNNLKGKKIPAGPPTVAAEDPLKDANAAVKAFAAEVDAAPRVMPGHFDRLEHLAAEWGPLYTRAMKKDKTLVSNPLIELGTAMRTRRAGEVAASYARLSEAVLAALGKKAYAEALAATKQLQTEVGDDLPGVVADLKTRVDVAVQEDYAAVKTFSDGLEKFGRWDEAKRHIAQHAPRFVGTDKEAILSGRATQITALAEAKAAEKAKPKPVEPPPVAVKPTDTPKPVKPNETPTPVKPNETPTPVKPNETPAPVPATAAMATLIEKMTADTAKSPLVGRTYEFADGKKGTITLVDPNLVTATIDGEPQNIGWTSIPAKTIVLMAGAHKLEAEDKLLVAELAYTNDLKEEGATLLKEYVGSKGTNEYKERKPKMDALLARLRNEDVPEGGYIYNGTKWGWESHAEMVNREALADAAVLCKEMKGDTIKEVDKDFKKVLAILADPEVTEANRDAIKKDTLAALGEYKSKRLKAIKSKANKGALQGLMKAKKELDEARKAALTVIYDHKIYPDENHGIVGQPKVDEKVKAVRDFWNGNASGIISPDVAREIDAVRKLNNSYLSQLGEAPSDEDLKEFDDIVNNLTGKAQVGIREVAASGAEREMYTYNKRVSKYNREVFKVQDGKVSKTCVDQAEVNNAYREMMGRRYVAMEASLCRAAQFHTENMAAAGSIWHEGSDGSPGSRCQKEGFSGPVGENCAMGYDGPEAVHNGWYNSSGHHRNMLSDSWNVIGVGNSGNFWTQNFGIGSMPPEFAGVK